MIKRYQGRTVKRPAVLTKVGEVHVFNKQALTVCDVERSLQETYIRYNDGSLGVFSNLDLLKTANK